MSHSYCNELRKSPGGIYEMNRGIDVVSAAWGGRKMYGLRIGYKGSQAGNTVEVAAGGDITLKHGAVGSEAVDTTVGLPTKNGIYDVSDSASNTFAEIIADINNSANWYALPASVPPTYVANNTLATRSAAAVLHVDRGGTLLEIDYAELDILVASSYILSRGLGLEDAEDLANPYMSMYDRATYPAKRFRSYKRQVLELFRVMITGAGQDATNTTFKIVRCQNGVYSTVDTPWSRTGWVTATEETVPSDGERGPVFVGNPGDNLWLVMDTTDTTTPDPAVLDITGFVTLHEGVG